MVNFYSQKSRQNGSVKEESDNKIVNNAQKSKASFQKYTDPTGEFGTSQFKRALWFVKNKLLLYRLLIIFLIIFSTITIGFSLWNGFNLLMYDLTVKPELERQLSMSVDYTALHPVFSPIPIEILNSYVLPGGTNKVDALSEATNPNQRFIVYFDYYYDFNGIVTERRSTFLLPGESRPITVFGLDSTAYAGSANLMVENVRFKRVDAHSVPDVISWQEQRMDFSTSDFTYAFAGEAGQSAHAIRFSLKNNTAYGYKNPKFLLGLYQNGGMVGIMPFDLTNFDSLESRQIDLRNFVQNLVVSEIRLYPLIDLYNKEVYLPPKK